MFSRLVHGAKGYATRFVESLEEKRYRSFKAPLVVECVHTTPDGGERRFSARATRGNHRGILALSEYSGACFDGKVNPHDFKGLDLKITLQDGTPILAKGTVTRVVVHRVEVRLNIKFLSRKGIR